MNNYQLIKVFSFSNDGVCILSIILYIFVFWSNNIIKMRYH